MVRTFRKPDYAPRLFFARGVADPRFIAAGGAGRGVQPRPPSSTIRASPRRATSASPRPSPRSGRRRRARRPRRATSPATWSAAAVRRAGSARAGEAARDAARAGGGDASSAGTRSIRPTASRLAARPAWCRSSAAGRACWPRELQRHAAAVSAMERTPAAEMDACNRSFLFAPGNVPRRVEKALTLEADAVIVDLEDSVALSDKAATRKAVADALAAAASRARLRARQCAVEPVLPRRPDRDDPKGVDGVVLPKVESAADLHAIDWLIWNLELERGIAPGSIDLMPQVETAAGVQRIDRILQARNLRPYKGAVAREARRLRRGRLRPRSRLVADARRSRARRRARARGARFARRRLRESDRQPLVPLQRERRLRARARAQPPRRLPGPAVRASGPARAGERARICRARQSWRAPSASSRRSRRPKRAARPRSRSTARWSTTRSSTAPAP